MFHKRDFDAPIHFDILNYHRVDSGLTTEDWEIHIPEAIEEWKYELFRAALHKGHGIYITLPSGTNIQMRPDIPQGGDTVILYGEDPDASVFTAPLGFSVPLYVFAEFDKEEIKAFNKKHKATGIKYAYGSMTTKCEVVWS